MSDLIKVIRSSGFLFLLATMMLLISCSKEDAEITNIENLADSTIEQMHHGAIGKNACLEFVFPLSITFADGSIATADSYEALHELVSTWFENNGLDISKENKPQLLFPIQVLTEQGDILELASKEELKTQRSECVGSGKCNGKKGKGFKCFSLVYPVTITIDGEDITFNDKSSLKEAVVAYKESAVDDVVRPTLVFPITVVYDDESVATANSLEELQAFKKACREGE